MLVGLGRLFGIKFPGKEKPSKYWIPCCGILYELHRDVKTQLIKRRKRDHLHAGMDHFTSCYREKVFALQINWGKKGGDLRFFFANLRFLFFPKGQESTYFCQRTSFTNRHWRRCELFRPTFAVRYKPRHKYSKQSEFLT